MTSTDPPRRAGPDDAEALTRLRAIMLDAMARDAGSGVPPAGDAEWCAATVTWFRERLADHDHFVAYVVDDPLLGTVASAVASVGTGAPVPGALGRPTGELFSVATEPRARRRGHARSCVTAVLGWLDARDVAWTDLFATDDGIALYRSLGFTVRSLPPMRRGRQGLEPW